MEQQIIGLAALYAVIEVIKFVLNHKEKAEECVLSQANQKKLDDLHDWHDHSDDDGRKIWYVPKHLHIEQSKMVEMLRAISSNQEATARLLAELLKKLDNN